jgi:hypothetical protein
MRKNPVQARQNLAPKRQVAAAEHFLLCTGKQL